MPLKTGNSRRVAKSRPVCMGLKAVMKLTFAIFKLLLSGKLKKLLSKEAKIERPNEIITLLKEIRRMF